MNRYRWLSTLLIAVLPLGFLATMIAAPLWALSAYAEGAWMWSVLSDEYIIKKLMWTVFQAAFTCLVAAPLAVPAAWALARLEFRGRKWLLRFLMLPFVMPTLVAGMGVLTLFGSRGILWAGWQDTPYLLLYGNVFFNLPLVVRAAYQGYLQVPAARLAAVRSLGASAMQRFWMAEWPLLRPWLIGACCLVFLYCFSGFGLALLLGGMNYSTIEVEIYQLITTELDIEQAGVLVWVSLGVTLLCAMLYTYFSRQCTDTSAAAPPTPQPPQNIAQHTVLAYTLSVLAICCALPLAAILFQAARAGASWSVLWEAETLDAAFNTLRFTAYTMPCVLLLGFLHAALAHRLPWLRSITFLPFMISPVCIAFGVLLLYPNWAASLPLLIATYTLLAYPFATKDILTAWDNLPRNFQAAARTLGATPRQTFRSITLPLLLPAARRGLTLAAATCLGEFAATLFLSRPEWQTLTTLIYRHLGTAGRENLDKALVLTAALMLLSVIVFIATDPSEPRRLSEKNKGTPCSKSAD